MLSLNKHYNLGTLLDEQVDQNWDDIEADVNLLSSRLPQNNYSATTNPTVNDDVTQGYSNGSLWYNRTTDTAFVLTNASSGAANWVERDSISASDLGSGAFADVVTSDSDDTVGRMPVIGWQALADAPPSGYWSATFKTMFLDFGYIGSNGAFATGIYSNGYRNGSGGWTSLGINSQTGGAAVEVRPDGRVSISADDSVAGATPQEVARFQESGCNIYNNLSVSGSFSKGSGSFRINHPLPEKAETHHLVHSFIEGPQADLVYRGRATLVDGEAQVDIDDVAGMTSGTFVLLCRDVQAWAQNDTGWSPVRASVSGATITIVCQDSSSSDVVSWLVVGERQDPHIMETDWTDEDGRVIVEPELTSPIETEED